MKDPALLKPPKEGEGQAHGTPFQARALLPPIISSCKAASTHQPPTEITDPQLSPTALIHDEAGPLPRHTHPIPPATPPLSRGGGEAACFSGSWGRKGGMARRTWPPPRGCLWSSRGKGERSQRPPGFLCLSYFALSASPGRVCSFCLPLSLSLFLRLLFPPRPEHTWFLTSDNPTTAAPPRPLPSSSPASSTLWLPDSPRFPWGGLGRGSPKP